jgi:hypothetical protein
MYESNALSERKHTQTDKKVSKHRSHTHHAQLGTRSVSLTCPACCTTAPSAAAAAAVAKARGELSVYHDLPGLATTTLSADVQTSGAAGPASPDMLMVLRLDSQRRGFPVGANNPSVGLMMARLAQECRPHRGPVATGVRLQDCVRVSGPGGAPVELDVALGKVRMRECFGVEV